MYARGLAALMLVAGCDALFGLDHVQAGADSNNGSADALRPDDAPVTMPDGPDPRIVVRFDFEGSLVETKSGIAATCITGTSCPTYKAAVHGMGIELDGINDCISFNPPANPSKLTVAFWLKSADRGQSVVAKPFGPGGVNTFQVDTETNRTVRFITYNNSASENLVNDSVLVTGVWTHVAATFDGGTKRVYVNGSPAPSSMPAGAMATDGQPLLIGCDRDSGNYVRFVLGMIDEVIVYDVALSASEIAALAQP